MDKAISITWQEEKTYHFLSEDRKTQGYIACLNGLWNWSVYSWHADNTLKKHAFGSAMTAKLAKEAADRVLRGFADPSREG